LITRHIGEWISVRAHAEREPLRLTLTFTLGELPDGWSESHRSRAATAWAGRIGVLLIAPFVALAVAGLLHAAGLTAPYDWIATNPTSIVAASVSLFIGLPAAFVINVWPITRLGLHRLAGEVEGLLALEFAPLQLIIALTALILGALFAGHLAADSLACLNGVHSAC
jgi:hypothetical protein